MAEGSLKIRVIFRWGRSVLALLLDGRRAQTLCMFAPPRIVAATVVKAGSAECHSVKARNVEGSHLRSRTAC